MKTALVVVLGGAVGAALVVAAFRSPLRAAVFKV